MIDRFNDSYWVTLRPRQEGKVFRESETPQQTLRSPQGDNKAIQVISDFLKRKGASCAVLLERSRGDLPGLPHVLFGSPSPAGEIVEEEGARFRVRLQGSRHPGLFLDHAPLRSWLRKNVKGLRVLNTFAYTGSLSVAAAWGAQSVVTLDLSKSSVSWARENWELNTLAPEKVRFIAGDVFEWLILRVE